VQDEGQPFHDEDSNPFEDDLFASEVIEDGDGSLVSEGQQDAVLILPEGAHVIRRKAAFHGAAFLSCLSGPLTLFLGTGLLPFSRFGAAIDAESRTGWKLKVHAGTTWTFLILNLARVANGFTLGGYGFPFLGVAIVRSFVLRIMAYYHQLVS
jgi:hypothetical protein